MSMNAAQRKHNLWLAGGRNYLQQQQGRIRSGTQQHLTLTQQLVMILTMEAPLLESLQQTLTPHPATKTIQEFRLNLTQPSPNNQSCLMPPSDDAQRDCLAQLARVLGAIKSLTSLVLEGTSATCIMTLLEACGSHLKTIQFISCDLLDAAQLATIVRTTFSLTTLTSLTLCGARFTTEETSNAFQFGINASSLDILVLHDVYFGDSFAEQSGKVLGCSKSLVQLEYDTAVSQEFFDAYCMELSKTAETKLERLCLIQNRRYRLINLQGDRGEAIGTDMIVMQKIRRLVLLNVQRRTCPPLFAAIGNAENGYDRKCSLVKAFNAVDCAIVFEYLVGNQYNMISLIQQLGRSRKRARSD